MKMYECPECGKIMQSRDWPYCSKRHKEIAMYQVLDWGRNGRPMEMKP